MLAAERRQIILEQLQAEKSVVVNQLSGFFSVSDETIRRDIDVLCKEGLAIKGYGGAILNENGPDLPFSVRKTHNATAKKKIADIIEGLVHDGESIILDASTTAVFVAKALKKKNRLTVVTNSIEVMIELADKPDWTVIATGGRLMGDYLALTGQRAIEEISSFYVDKLIFSCKGLDVRKGMFESNDEFAQIKRAMLKAARVKVLAVDESKFGRTAFARIAGVKDVDVVVADTCPEVEWVDALNGQGVDCLY
ncbi:MAG: DeoR/GlpR family DNA-binding transcription regulator [Defluviitaleaceae bacterium]|nr:DeoR/GlpR family DNA-binding transcription regulator [Defluviitaleaceae bacterium]